MVESSGDMVGALRAEIELLEEKVAQLQHALESRIVIEQAKGAVSVRCQVTAEVAFQMIRARARGQRRNMQEFCAEVIDNQGRMDGLPCNNGHVRLQL